MASTQPFLAQAERRHLDGLHNLAGAMVSSLARAQRMAHLATNGGAASAYQSSLVSAGNKHSVSHYRSRTRLVPVVVCHNLGEAASRVESLAGL